VPAYYKLRSGGDEAQYLRLLGYKIGDDGSRESTDDFVGRAQGYVMLYAAMTQSDNPRNPHGLGQAWGYLARLLNALPADRVTAAALDAFLKVAGYRLHAAYRGQFMKLLRCVHSDFLSQLSASGDVDARAVYTRLATYLDAGRFGQPPEGRTMPATDASSRERA
jgi:nucleoporin GLE1